MRDDKSTAALIVAKLHPEPKADEAESGDDGLAAAMQELIDAIGAKDAEGAAKAFRSAFAICESMPHDEYGEEEEAEA